jgi:hypothetical protein
MGVLQTFNRVSGEVEGILGELGVYIERETGGWHRNSMAMATRDISKLT